MDPRDESIFYVGITEDVFKRFLAHINCESRNAAKNIIITELHADNRLPILEELERVEGRSLAEERETYWIRFFQEAGDPLTNIHKLDSQQPNNPRKDRLSRESRERLLRRKQKSDLERKIADFRRDGLTLKEIADQLGTTYHQVQKICSRMPEWENRFGPIPIDLHEIG